MVMYLDPSGIGAQSTHNTYADAKRQRLGPRGMAEKPHIDNSGKPLQNGHVNTYMNNCE